MARTLRRIARRLLALAPAPSAPVERTPFGEFERDDGSTVELWRGYRDAVKGRWRSYWWFTQVLFELDRGGLLPADLTALAGEIRASATLPVPRAEIAAAVQPLAAAYPELVIATGVRDESVRADRLELVPEAPVVESICRSYASTAARFLAELAGHGFAASGARALEIGCGSGYMSFAVAGAGLGEVVASDIDIETYVGGTERDRVRASFGEAAARVSLAVADATALPFEDDSLDLVFSFSAMEHVRDPAAALREYARILRSGGFAYHAVDPWFSPQGGHSMCILDFPWGHVRLTAAEFERYVSELRPHEAEEAIAAYHRDFQAPRLTISSVEAYAVDAGFELLAVTESREAYRNHVELLDGPMLADCARARVPARGPARPVDGGVHPDPAEALDRDRRIASAAVSAILGLNAYHGDAAAALVVDGELVAAAEEERFNRVKHSAGFPALAAAWCLADAGLSAADLDHVAVSRDPKANFTQKLVQTVRRGPSLGYLRSRLENASKVRDVRSPLAAALGVEAGALRARFHNVEHHQAHIASAFFVSPFEDAAALSLDGFGDFASTMLAEGRGNRFTVLDRVLFPHSLGIFYTAVTQWLGFPHYGDEGKVMGLAPYGTPRYLDELRRLVKLDGELFQLELGYFTHHDEGVDMTWDQGSPTIGSIFSQELVELLGPAREPGSDLTSHHEDVAASMQAVLEEAYLHVVNTLWEKTRLPNLCLAGGVALNAVVNGRILPETPFEELYIQPAAGDSGTAVGAAYYVWNQELGGPRGFVMEHAYAGPDYSADDYDAALAEAGLASKRLADDQLFPAVAERIAAGEVVGWFQGRMEFGPRALGNRSIVTDPRRDDMKDTLNERIKQREPFRPFAPSVLAEKVGEWYEQDYPSPFMVLVYTTRADKRERIPAVNHVDDTGRVQAVERDVNPRYYRLIEEFEKLTGVPIVLNTSFNENEPIVMTPAQAIETFQKTKMDVLVLENHVVRRQA
jgi:carbamoyltransferase